MNIFAIHINFELLKEWNCQSNKTFVFKQLIGFAKYFLNLMLITNVKATCFRLLNFLLFFSSTVISSVIQSCPTLCVPMDCSTPGFPVGHHLPELAQSPLGRWCHPTISFSVVHFSSCLQSFPALGLFQFSIYPLVIISILQTRKWGRKWLMCLRLQLRNGRARARTWTEAISFQRFH